VTTPYASLEITEIEVNGYERVMRCRDQSTGLHALIAVHNTVLGPALGGMRMLPYASEDEALFDVLRLSAGMTYKSAVAETGLGGGKSVVIGDPKKSKTPALLQAMGAFVDSFGGRYITAEDMNIGISDLLEVRKGTKWVTGLRREDGGSGNPSPYTAYGVLCGQRAVLEEFRGRADFGGQRVLIQGVGAVGSNLAERLAKEGAKVLVCDLDAEKARALASRHRYEWVANDGHHRVECDVYAPCATGAGLNDRTIPELRCKAVAGAANNQLLKPEDAEALQKRGIVYAPDYVINAGGIINVACELLRGGYDEATALRRIEGIYGNLKKVFQLAKEQRITTHAASTRLAEQRIQAGRR
jgi:leucine dehydrogenase